MSRASLDTSDCGSFDLHPRGREGLGLADGVNAGERSRLESVFAGMYDCHSCSCHINPPCSQCVDCLVCAWRNGATQDELEGMAEEQGVEMPDFEDDHGR